MKVSCVIPVYNEAPRLKAVFDEVSKVNGICEIIAVDDGSSDGSSKIVETFHDVKLIRHEKNLGKTAAILSGVRESIGDAVFLIDADVSGCNASEIDNGIELFNRQNLDMLIFRRVNSRLLNQILRANILITGERIVRKEIIQKVLQSGIVGYEVEFALNHFIMQNKLKVSMSDISTQNINKSHKYRLPLIGLLLDIKMHLGILVFNAGFFKYNYPKQFLTFCLDESEKK